MERARTKVTIDDVAKRAGVAKSTVSRTINNAPWAKPVTKQKVTRIIEELGFAPNLMARSLKTKRRRQRSRSRRCAYIFAASIETEMERNLELS